MKGFLKNTVFILLGMAGLVLTAPSQTTPIKQGIARLCSSQVYAGLSDEPQKALTAGNKISLEEARFVFACW